MSDVRPRVGVLTFPGSCDDEDALLALDALGAEPVALWHAEATLRDVAAVVLPGGFSYGDYLRCGAIARFSPAMRAVERFAAAGGPVLGICNGFHILCEAGLLPGVLRPNERAMLSNSLRPSSEPRSRSEARSGCGIRPMTFPDALTTPATPATDPFGFSPSA